MKRPPKPGTRVAPSPGWMVRHRLHRGKNPRPVGETKLLTPALLGIQSDPELEEQIAKLHLLELENLRAGADIRHQAYAIARRPELYLRLERSEELEEKSPGHCRFRGKRRRGILRHPLNEPDLGTLPFFLPLVPPIPGGTEWKGLQMDLHLGRLVDEMEHLWIPIFRTSYGWRPMWKVMNSIQMRAVLAINATTFYELNREIRIPGRLSGGLPGCRYDTETVMRWLFRSGYMLFEVPLSDR